MVVHESEKMGTLHQMKTASKATRPHTQKPTILTAYMDGPDDFVEVQAEDVEVPEEVTMELVRVGAIDYATAQNFTLQKLFDLLME